MEDKELFEFCKKITEDRERNLAAGLALVHVLDPQAIENIIRASMHTGDDSDISVDRTDENTRVVLVRVALAMPTEMYNNIMSSIHGTDEAPNCAQLIESMP